MEESAKNLIALILPSFHNPLARNPCDLTVLSKRRVQVDCNGKNHAGHCGVVTSNIATQKILESWYIPSKEGNIAIK
ncbi:hypothetical protein [Lancefieldella parvula]|uniref:hypothetical protein n=1 Tax=Lancefieldella parvula TaxID=1382 RepID=UPI0012E03ECF|nr:hypothetical protein [Lancefieldella parvula]